MVQKIDALERKRYLFSMCQYLYAVPGHNANVEKTFSLIVAPSGPKDEIVFKLKQL